MISERARAALDAAKRRGVKLGGFRGRAGTCTDLAKARAVRSASADQRAVDLADTIEQLRTAGAQSLRSIATGLNAREITTAGGGHWSATQVRTVLARIGGFGSGAGNLTRAPVGRFPKPGFLRRAIVPKSCGQSQ